MQKGANSSIFEMKLEPSDTDYEQALSPTFEPKDSYVGKGTLVRRLPCLYQ